MIRTESVFSLLFAHGADCDAHRIVPLRVERLRPASSLPISMRQPDRIAERIQFILALADALLHLGLVLAAPLERRSIQVRHNGIGTGIDEDVLKSAGIEKADVFVAVTNGDNTNVMAAQIVQAPDRLSSLSMNTIWRPPLSRFANAPSGRRP